MLPIFNSVALIVTDGLAIGLRTRLLFHMSLAKSRNFSVCFTIGLYMHIVTESLGLSIDVLASPL